MKNNNTPIWKMKDMINYAINQYHLLINFNNNFNDRRDTYEKAIRRQLVNLELVKKDESTGKYIYELSEEKAKFFIDVTMKSYFSKNKRIDVEEVKNQYLKEDDKLNKENFDKMVEESDYLSECYANGIDPYECDIIIQDEMEKSILKMMIKAIFNIFYGFDEEQYKKDYTELKSLVNSDDVYQTYQNGYSLLKNKMDNPIENYCTLKK